VINSRCRPPGTCSPGTVACPAGQTPDPAGGCRQCLDAGQCPVPADGCQVAVCTNGACGVVPAPDGTPCNDGNACTQIDSCLNGACVGTNAVECVARDGCHVAGVCDPVTGICSDPTAANGTPCDDGTACTRDDVCTDGRCGGTPVASCATCETFADCPDPDPDNSCEVPACEDGRCDRSYLPVRTSCPYPQDRCVAEARCERLIGPATICRPVAYSDAPACVYPCETAADCANRAGPCQTMACVYDSHVGAGGCVVVADQSRDGTACTLENIFGAGGGGPFSERLCIPDGTCQGGVCTEGPRTYTCSQTPTVQCCFGQKDACGRPNGGECTENRNCCSDNCVDNVCAA
jgi:hypothetical protein